MVVVTFLLLFPDFHGMFAGMEGFAFDLYMKMMPESRAAADSPVVIDVDDQSYRDCFGSASPLKPEKVMDLVNLALKNEAKVVAVDLVTDSEGYRFLHTDAAEGQSVIWSATASVVSREVSFLQWLVGCDAQFMKPGVALGQMVTPNPGFLWAVPAYARDDDLRIRRLPRSYPLENSKELIPALSRKTAMRFRELPSDANAPELMITHKGEKLDRIPATKLLGCTPNGKLEPTVFPDSFKEPALSQQGIKDRIVLVGGTFRQSNDFHESSHGMLPGVVINANAIQAELNGHYVANPKKVWLFLLDVIIGTVFTVLVWRFPPANDWRLILVTIIAVVLLYVIAGRFLLAANILWVSWTGALIGAVSGFIVERGFEKPKPSTSQETVPPVSRV